MEEFIVADKVFSNSSISLKETGPEILGGGVWSPSEVKIFINR
jgi:hypothetical protein